MIRALSTNRNRHNGYDKLMDLQLRPPLLGIDDDDDDDDDNEDVSKVKLKRVTSLPTWKTFGSMKHVPQPTRDVAPPLPPNFPTKSVKKVSKTHPFFGLFDSRNKKKAATSKPEFGRYLEYLKEGGMWDANSNQPVMYFK